MKKLLFIPLVIFAIACNKPSDSSSAYDGGTNERGALSEYANKPLEGARAVDQASEERNKKMQEQLDF